MGCKDLQNAPDDLEWLAGKIVRLRIFNDEQGVMNRSVQEIQGDIMLISQFTLYASTKKGNRPSYSQSAPAEKAIMIFMLPTVRIMTIRPGSHR